MLIRMSLRLAAVLGVATSNAFLIPSTMSAPTSLEEGGLDAFTSLISRPHSISSTTRFIDCTACLWPFETEVGNSVLSFGVSLSKDHKTLLFNSVPIYPIPLESENLTPLIQTHPIDAIQLFTSSEDSSKARRSIRYSGYIRATKANDGDPSQLLDFHIIINRLDEQVISVENLNTRILETEEGGELFILTPLSSDEEVSVMTRPDILPRPAIQPAPSSCGTGPFSVLCRLRTFISSKLSSPASPRRHGSCHGRHGSSMRGQPFVKGGPAKFSHIGEGANPIRMPRPHSPSNVIVRTLHFLAIGVLVPILIGIAAGLTASMLGMMIGTAVAWFWVRFVRGRNIGELVRMDQEITRCDMAGKEEQWVEGEGVAFMDEKVGHAIVEEREIAEPPPGYVEKE